MKNWIWRWSRQYNMIWKEPLKNSPLRSGNTGQAEDYGPYVLWIITPFWGMGMSQEAENADVSVQSVAAMRLTEKMGNPGDLNGHIF